MDAGIKRLFNRHIAKALSQLGDTIAPVQIASIKRSFRFLEEDINTYVTEGTQNDTQDPDRFNR